MTRDGAPIEIRAAPGIVEVRLPETPTSGYLWKLDRPPSGVAQVATEYREEGGGLVAGGSGVRSFRLSVPAPGTYELEFVLRRPWEAESLERRRVTLTVSS